MASAWGAQRYSARINCPAEAFPQRVFGDQPLQLGYDGGVVAAAELAFQTVLKCSETHLLFEPGGVGAGEPLVDEIGQRRPAPQIERLAEAFGRERRVSRHGRAGIGQQTLEPDHIELMASQSQ